MKTDLAEETFLKNVEGHEMQVLLDNGIYRHLRFKKPQTGIAWFDIVTWPGYLAYTGDMGSFVFERVHDMLTFFRGKRRYEHLDINPSYWAEKLRAVDRDGRSGSFEEYSEEKMREHIEDGVKTWVEEFEVPYDEECEPTEEQLAKNVKVRKAFEDELRAAVKNEVLVYIEDGEHKVREMVNEFSFTPENPKRFRDREHPYQSKTHGSGTPRNLRFASCGAATRSSGPSRSTTNPKRRFRPMSKTIHLCVSIRGMLNWDARETKRNLKWITKTDGTRFASIGEFRNNLLDMIAEGKEVLPTGECEGFDYKTGCPGHETEPA